MRNPDPLRRLTTEELAQVKPLTDSALPHIQSFLGGQDCAESK